MNPGVMTVRRDTHWILNSGGPQMMAGNWLVISAGGAVNSETENLTLDYKLRLSGAGFFVRQKTSLIVTYCLPLYPPQCPTMSITRSGQSMVAPKDAHRLVSGAPD